MTGIVNTRKNYFSDRKTQLLIASILFFAVMAISKPDTFLTLTNFQSIMVQISDLGIFALAMAITMIAGGIDLSIINLANLVAVINAIVIKAIVTDSMSNTQINLVLLLCLGLSLLIGFIAGAINSFLIANLRIPEILATLATMNLYLGIATIITGGQGIIGFPQQLLDIGSESILGIPVPFIIFLLIVLILYIIVHLTPYGTQLKLFGLNPKAAHFSGIDNKKVIYKTHIIACMVSSVAGLLVMARTNSATIDYGGPLILTTLLIGVLSGIHPTGGNGDVINIFLALLLNQFLKSGLNLLRVSSFVREMVPAALLITIVSLEHYFHAVIEKRLNRKALIKNAQLQNTKVED